MYYRDHSPPHFHAIYGEHEAEFEIGTTAILAGSLPRRAHQLVNEWATANRDAIRENWELARQGEPLNGIAPLK